MKVNQKLDKPLLIAGILFVLLGLLYKARDFLPVEISELFFWLPQRYDMYYKVAEAEPEFKFGLLFFSIGIIVLVFRRLTIKDAGSDE
uniref:hypothetical protein n=1 Tax=Ningiella ruwaisensis TaxID=2364274 RepID=UPI00109F5289|nr:hypothetical protein [Ningiella ruwaisensis]